ncbi:MAG: hypothetical protein MUC42_15450 [Bryobacter sp.]|nr:hypothetical protein [Bryobacter sp.]
MQPSPVAPLPPQRKAAAPAVVPEPPRSRAKWFILLLFVAAAAGGWYWYSRPQTQAAPVAAVRTFTVSTGAVEKTIRLTGVTAAENFASLIVPQTRGSRSGRGRDGSSTSMASISVGSIGGSVQRFYFAVVGQLLLWWILLLDVGGLVRWRVRGRIFFLFFHGGRQQPDLLFDDGGSDFAPQHVFHDTNLPDQCALLRFRFRQFGFNGELTW